MASAFAHLPMVAAAAAAAVAAVVAPLAPRAWTLSGASALS